MGTDGIKIGTEIEHKAVAAIALRIARACELAGDKAVANLIDSASFPMPKETDALEHLMAKRLRILSAEQRDTARNMVDARIDAAPAVRETMLGDLVAVSLRKNISVSKQVKALPIPADIKLGLTEIASMKPKMAPKASAAVVNGHKKLTLRIHNVKCVDETGTEGLFGSEGIGDDEISLGGTVIGVTGATAEVKPFNVSSSFEDGDIRVFNPLKSFFTFDLTRAKQFPKTAYATLVLAERDMGAISDFVNELTEKVEDKVVDFLKTVANGELPGLGEVLGDTIESVVDRIFDYLKSAWSDDVFKPVFLKAKISYPTHTFANGKIHSPDRTVTFRGHNGTYTVKHDWLLSA